MQSVAEFIFWMFATVALATVTIRIALYGFQVCKDFLKEFDNG